MSGGLSDDVWTIKELIERAAESMILADSLKGLQDIIHGMTYVYAALLLVFAAIASLVVSFVILFVINRFTSNANDTDSENNSDPTA